MAPMHCVEKAVENETQWMQHSATENVECSGWQVGLEVGLAVMQHSGPPGCTVYLPVPVYTGSDSKNTVHVLQTTTFENLRNNRNIVCDPVTNYF